MQKYPEMKSYLRTANVVHIDGMSIVLLMRLAGIQARRVHRLSYVDLWPHLAAHIRTHGLRTMFIGGLPEHSDRFRAFLSQELPGCDVKVQHGFFSRGSTEEQAVAASVQAFAPDILLLGMGMPKQELFLFDHKQLPQRGAVFSVGAMLEYFIGVQPQPPRWIGQMGLEWLYRLARDPRRLAYRYLVEPILIFPAICQEILRQRLGK